LAVQFLNLIRNAINLLIHHMPTAPPSFDATGSLIAIRRPSDNDCDELIALAQASVDFLRPWIDPPMTRDRFNTYLQSRRTSGDDGFLICERGSNRIAGLINLNCIVRGAFHSAYLGYWIGAPFAKKGYMSEAMRLVIHHAFTEMKLHRVEANIQPQNLASIALVRRCGFVKEGFSPRYLQVFGQWRDHERWALRADQESSETKDASTIQNALSSVRGGYDRSAAIYDHDANPLQAMEGPIVRAALGNVHDLKALDLGCGTGRHTLWLAENGATVTALDFSQGMLAEARRKSAAVAIQFLQHDLHERLPFENGSFDIIVSGLVLEHLRDLPAFFSEAHRVLKPTGRAIVSTMHPAMFLRGTQARFTDPTTGELIQPGSIAHPLSEITMSAVRAGFKLSNLQESAPDADFAAKYPRAEKYIGWPMLVVLSLIRDVKTI
jgi:RimJ/RimL family protein N-acetyltransferase/ubiquinone/menaquinone biosynthesis C-methylase UbiE